MSFSLNNTNNENYNNMTLEYVRLDPYQLMICSIIVDIYMTHHIFGGMNYYHIHTHACITDSLTHTKVFHTKAATCAEEARLACTNTISGFTCSSKITITVIGITAMIKSPARLAKINAILGRG